MRLLLTTLALVSTCTLAAEPSDAVINSCLAGESISAGVSYRSLPSQEVLSQDDYRPGYNATYYVNVGGNEVGYAEGKNKQAIIYAGRLYPLESAIVVKGGSELTAVPFNPDLAEWGQIREQKYRYLCVSFNFDGLGRSGSYQNVRAGYLLDASAPKRKLYFSAQLLRSSSESH